MALERGTRIGVYEILSSLGAGGMGEVYRARDTKLQRDVALKVLPPAFTDDVDRVTRFNREARLLASLNHPHIGTIFGFEDAGSVAALVLELVEGETLDGRLTQGPLQPSAALDVAAQIADALDAAHGAGIVHRDLKPSNIKITPDGVVKLLDFGLAKVAKEDPTLDISQMATDADGTRAGAILGTVAYMSPEQARGKAVDKRTDIWAFGCVLFQMLTGRPAFHGDTMSDTIAAILEREADWRALPAATPPAVLRLLQRCLEKDARTRLRDIGDVRHWLEELRSPLTNAGATVIPRRRGVVWLLGGMALVAAVAVTVGAMWRSPAAPVARNVQVQRLTDLVGIEESPAISPDGKTIAFVARAGSKRQIWLRLLAGGAPLQITRDDTDHELPRWAPDSSSLIYFVPSLIPGAAGTLWEIAALGGEPRRLAVSLSGGDLSHDGKRIAFFRFEETQMALVVIARDGSLPAQVRRLTSNSIYEYPRWSPNDQWIAFQRDNLAAAFDERVFVVSMERAEDPREVARGTDLNGLSWLPEGSGVVYSSSAGSTVLYPPMYTLRAVERDGTGDRQLTFGDVSYVEPDVHSSGMVTGSRFRYQSDIWKFPIDGSPADNTRRGIRITNQTGAAQTPSVSPDESEVVYLSDSGGHGNLWIARTDGSSVRQITYESDPAVSVGVPVWAPNRNEIVFILTRPGQAGLSVINRDGSGLRQLIPFGIGANWSIDGRWVYYMRSTADGSCIEKMPVEGGTAVSVRCGTAGAPAPAADGLLYFVNMLIKSNGTVDHELSVARTENGPSAVLARVTGLRAPLNRRQLTPVLAPDGKWLAMPLLDVGTSNIWVQPTSGEAMRPVTDFAARSVTITRRVSWSPDSKYLYAAVADTDADIVLMHGLVR